MKVDVMVPKDQLDAAEAKIEALKLELGDNKQAVTLAMRTMDLSQKRTDEMSAQLQDARHEIRRLNEQVDTLLVVVRTLSEALSER